jgi:hypothetical protein
MSFFIGWVQQLLVPFGQAATGVLLTAEKWRRRRAVIGGGGGGGSSDAGPSLANSPAAAIDNNKTGIVQVSFFTEKQPRRSDLDCLVGFPAVWERNSLPLRTPRSAAR